MPVQPVPVPIRATSIIKAMPDAHSTAYPMHASVLPDQTAAYKPPKTSIYKQIR